MKIKIAKDTMLKALQRVSNIVNNRNTLPVLSNILFEAADGKLKLTGTDLEIRMETEVDAEVIEAGETTLPAKKMLTLVSKFRGEFIEIEDDKVYVIEANPRASRTVPLVSKVGGVQMAGIATHLMLGDTVKSMGLDKKHVVPYFGVKEAVLPFDKFPEVDPVLGPEMRSTGEVLGLADNFGLAYFKSQEAAGAPLPTKPGRVLVSLTQKQADIESAVKKLVDLGFTILATEGTANWLRDLGIPAYPVAKIGEGRPDCLDVIKNREVSLVINTPSVKANSIEHLGRIRKACIKYKVPYLTTIAAAYAAAEGIEAAMSGKGEVKSLQEYHATIS